MSGSKTALVTGIHGFTGRYMRAELEWAGYRVVGLGVAPATGADYRQVDLLDAEGLQSVVQEVAPDVIVHLAAVAFVGHSDANAFYRVNLMGTRNLLEAAGGAGKVPDCVLLASSANVYGNSSEGMLDEGTPVAPVNDYAVSKLAMEFLANLYRERMPLVVVRPFNYTGVGQADNFVVPKIVSHFRNGASAIELGNLDVWRDFGDVRSVVQAYRLLLEAPAARGKTFNICSGRAYSLREIIGLCENMAERRIEVRVNPQFVRANEVKKLWGDCSRLRGVLGDWQSFPLEDTLRWMLNYSVEKEQ